MYIEVCGGIASGKTTFANLIDEIDIKTVLEDFEKNPFWKDFYENPGEYIFETEITFLLQHYNQIKKSISATNQGIICDFSFFLDLAYAEIGLTGSKLKAFYAVFNELKSDLPSPSLVVYLNCDAGTELDRIRHRCREVENNISIEFLDKLNNYLEAQVKKVQGNIKILTIDSAKNDFSHDMDTREKMKQLMLSNIKDLPRKNR